MSIKNYNNTTPGPLQIQNKGPWLESFSKEQNGDTKYYLSIRQLGNNTSLKPTQLMGDHPISIQAIVPGYIQPTSKDVDEVNNPYMIPNVQWIQSYVNAVLSYKPEEGVPPPTVDLNAYVFKTDFQPVADDVEKLKTTTAYLTTNLTDLETRVKIIEKWEDTLENKTWILDGGDPLGNPRYITPGEDNE